MRKLLIALIVVGSLGWSAHPAGHTLGALVAMNATEELLRINNLGWLSPVALPMSAMASHMVLDRAIDEAYQGAWQVDIGIFTLIAGWLGQPTPERKDRYLMAAFWGALVPDSILKKQTHPDWLNSGDKIFTYTRDNNQLAELLCLNATLAFDFKFSF